MSSLLCGRPACMLLWHRRWCTPPARHCFSDLRAMCWLELMFPECTTVFSLESLLWVSALIMFLLLSPQTLQWVSREYSDTGGSDFSASEAAYGRLTLGSPAGMSTRIYVCLQWWKLLLFFFLFSQNPHSFHIYRPENIPKWRPSQFTKRFASVTEKVGGDTGDNTNRAQCCQDVKV